MLIWILAAVASLILVVFVVGSLLPEDYRASGRLDLDLPPEQLWEKLVDFQKHPIAARQARKVEALPQENGMPVWIEDLGSSKVRVRTTARQPHRFLVREMADQVVPMSARVEVQIEPHNGGSRVLLDNHIRVRRGTWHVPVFRVMLKLFRGHRSGMQAYFAQMVGRKNARFVWR